MRAGKQRTTTRLIGLVVLAVLATGCEDTTFTRGGFPEPITREGHKLLGVWRGSLITAGCVGLFVIGLILYSAIFFRRRSDDELPRQVRYNLPIEVLYTFIPMVMVAILFYFTAIRENDVDQFKTDPDVTIGVVGFQWNWQFNYLDPDAQLSVTGRPGEYPQLVLPAGATVRFEETSPDVIHAFWVIPFLFKRDVVPGRTNMFQITLDNHTGTYQGKCTEFCGTDHDRMLFTLKVVTPSDYQKWLSDTKALIATPHHDPMFDSYTADAVNTTENQTENTDETQRSTQ